VRTPKHPGSERNRTDNEGKTANQMKSTCEKSPAPTERALIGFSGKKTMGKGRLSTAELTMPGSRGTLWGPQEEVGRNPMGEESGGSRSSLRNCLPAQKSDKACPALRGGGGGGGSRRNSEPVPRCRSRTSQREEGGFWPAGDPGGQQKLPAGGPKLRRDGTGLLQ